jgi:hypothetical protein
VRLDADKIIAKERPNIAWKGGNGASQRREVYPVQTVHLNIAWLSSDSKIYLAKRVAAKRTAQVTHRTIRSLVSNPTNIVETWNVRENRQSLFAIWPE